MIVKNFELKKKLQSKINFYLLYGYNTGQIEETINTILAPKFSKNLTVYDEIDIINNLDSFYQNIYNKSFFEDDKLIIINRVTDKIYEIIKKIIESDTENIKIILKQF